jgi:hypothetical protein
MVRRNWWLILVILLTACANPDVQGRSSNLDQTGEDVVVSRTEEPTTSLEEENQPEIPPDVPDVDITKHSVPLSQVFFDTFQPVNRALPLDQATQEIILRLRDAIPPIHEPKYETAEQASWLNPDDMVIGYTAGDKARAYPIRILNFHEIVNDFLGDEPVLISYCPLCYSGIVYSRRLGEDVLTFGNTSALYESDMVMLDYQTGSYWWQVAGEAIVGELTGKKLTVLPSTTISWREWQNLFPDTLILSRDTGFPRNYDRDPFGSQYVEIINGGRFAFPVSDDSLDPRLLPGDIILAVRVDDEVRGYPVGRLAGEIVMDTVGGQSVVVFVDPSGDAGFVFDPMADGKVLTFIYKDGEILDQETGSSWDLSGKAVAGPLQGSQLSALPSKTSFWFAIFGAEPDIQLFAEG